MTMPKFEPVAWLYFHSRQTPELDLCFEQPLCVKSFDTDATWKKSLHTADQLAEAYEAGKLAGIPEGWVLVPKEILDRFPEINPSNYDHDDVCNLNAWGVELVLAAAPKGLKK